MTFAVPDYFVGATGQPQRQIDLEIAVEDTANHRRDD
jgi:hypothetical protein